MTTHKKEDDFVKLSTLIVLCVLIVIATMTAVVWWRVTNPDPSPNSPPEAVKTIYRDAVTPEPTMEAWTIPPPQVDRDDSITELTLIQLARNVKPISMLEHGDRVLYDGNEARPVCEFLHWAPSAISRGSIVNAMIQCPDEGPFEIQTGYLTSIEKQ